MHDRKLSLTLAALLVLSGISTITPAQVRGKKATTIGQTARRDSRVEQALGELGFNYTLMTWGGFGVRINYTDTRRTQDCFIDSVTAVYGNLETREVWSRAMLTRGPLSAATANRLLLDKNKFGGWRMTDAGDDGTLVLYYSAQVGADADAATLKSVIDLVTVAADLMERELTSKDEH